MRRNDWKRNGVEHLERKGCIINIREKLQTSEDGEVTSIEIIPDDGWIQEGYLNNRIIKRKTLNEQITGLTQMGK